MDQLSFTNYAVMAYEQKEKFLEGLSEAKDGSEMSLDTRVELDEQIKEI